MINIDIERLQLITNLLFERLKEAKGPNVELDNDYYWYVDTDEMYDPTVDPKEFLLGQASFDWDHIQRADPGYLRPNDFNKIAAIFRFIADEHPIAF